LDKKKRVIFIDTNVFIVDLRYKNDANFSANRTFLNFMAKSGDGITSIINVLEVCGILSFNLNDQQLQELFYYLPVKYSVDVLPSHNLSAPFPASTVNDLMEILKKKASLGDASIASLVNRSLPERSLFISWDARHFKDLLTSEALTPREFMARQR